MGIEASLCVALALSGQACERTLEALDKQYELLEPARQLEKQLRVGFEHKVGKRAADTITFFIGASFDWQLKQRIYLEVGGTF